MQKEKYVIDINLVEDVVTYIKKQPVMPPFTLEIPSKMLNKLCSLQVYDPDKEDLKTLLLKNIELQKEQDRKPIVMTEKTDQ